VSATGRGRGDSALATNWTGAKPLEGAGIEAVLSIFLHGYYYS
jgi:hypothetical protein